ncbi:Cysteine-rich membrane protein 1 [Spironucleus salmonicida]|uniref:Cysteine-rich membrane protein 1 n=1 Tax=Spironucleus salmonicida TaxID=348837 RepID=A0A9P8RWW9_9EUKA|nr:Cysteine-rich membrane protein 1 [Spironucleus salmonicida]
MADPGTCVDFLSSCKAGFYCPEDGQPGRKCLVCSEQTGYFNSCNCQDSVVTPHCRECAGGVCTVCVDSTYLENGACEDCIPGCERCVDGRTCLACEDGYLMNTATKRCEAVCKMNSECDYGENQFCDQSNKTCKACRNNCEFCLADNVCTQCSSRDHALNHDGTCTTECPNLQNGQYCKNGTAMTCAPGLTSDCKCGFAINCASCTSSGNSCATCVPNTSKDRDGKCLVCAEGYELLNSSCWPKNNVPPVSGTCSSEVSSCRAGYFCDATGTKILLCKPCSAAIKPGQGCYCADGVATADCLSCSGATCATCISGSFLVGGKCERCPVNCAVCANAGTCTTCATGYISDPAGKCVLACKGDKDCKNGVAEFCDRTTGKCASCIQNCQTCGDTSTCKKCKSGYSLVPSAKQCIVSCRSSQDCSGGVSQFCNSATGLCGNCSANCAACASSTVCSSCSAGFVATTSGVCVKGCANLQNGQYCKDAAAASCAEGIDSQCKCGDNVNCATCDLKTVQCEKCLKGILKDESGKCMKCLAGHTLIGSVCQKDPDVPVEDGNKLSGGAIAGIVIAMMVLIGGIGCGVVYYLMKRYKK